MSIIESWIRVREALLPSLALCGGSHTEDDVLHAIYTGRMGLWVSDDQKAALVTEQIVTPQKKLLNCFICGGDLASLKTLEPAVTAWARDNNITQLRIFGRKGWATVFDGAETAAVMMIKEI